ncbi:MAG: flagellar basal-body rod protein FlgF [Legionella sp.]|nr:flagellar basal-body rod protein FlgF [Legionella sp.]HRD70271.1 flagellar basal-body rod protein FlgF [Legionella sp.]
MDPILYTAIGGGRSDFRRQELIANNLANLNTPGFKADLYQAQTLYMNNSKGMNHPSGQSFVVQGTNGIDLSPGEIMTTGRELDVAIDGMGWMAVKGAGGESYTRGGRLKIDVNGQLTTSSGKAVLGDGGPISIPPAKSIEIGSDGTISIVPLDGDGKTLAVLDRIKLVTLDKTNVVKTEEGLLRLKSGGGVVADPNVVVVGGALEGSNVKAIDQMVGMISAGREFEAQMKILSTADENGQKLAQVLHE